MPRKIEITVYTYEELNEQAQANARFWFSSQVYDDNWWEHIYTDAETIGIKIMSFDTERNRHAKGDFIKTPDDVARAILTEHGETCATYQSAKAYMEDCAKIEKEHACHDERSELIDDRSTVFLHDLLEDYAVILQREAEYLVSDEYLTENIIANEYTFTDTGRRFG